MNKLLVKLDYWLLHNSYRLPEKLADKYSFPTDRLLKHCWGNFKGNHIKYIYEEVAYMYYYDKTVTRDNLSLIKTVYDIQTEERIRQILCKFVRRYYR